MDVSTQRLRYFVTVADELHFSRAATRLFISQQALSKQVRELESDLGTQLFQRSTRQVELTPAGRAFLSACREALGRLDEGIREARQMGQGEQGTLRLGFFVAAALELTPPILTEFEARHPRATVVMREFAYSDPTAGLSDGSSDLAVVRLPISLPDLNCVPLFTEPRVVAVSTRHRLAARDRVSVRELAGERMTRGSSDDPAFRRFWSLADYLPAADPPPIQTTSHNEELEVVATGRACSITAACAARLAPRAAVRLIPIDDIPGVTTALAWRSGRSALAGHFVDVALAVRDRETDIVRAIESPRITGILQASDLGPPSGSPDLASGPACPPELTPPCSQAIQPTHYTSVWFTD